MLRLGPSRAATEGEKGGERKESVLYTRAGASKYHSGLKHDYAFMGKLVNPSA